MRILASDTPVQVTYVHLSRQKKEIYLRVDSRLSIPPMSLQYPYRRIPISLREVRELGNSRLLLRTICWRHLVSAPLSPILLCNPNCAVVAGVYRGVGLRRGRERGGTDDVR